MNWLKVIFTSAIAIIFIGSTFIALFGAGEALNAVFRTYVFNVEQCRFDYPQRVKFPPEMGMSSEGMVEPEETCSIDYNETRRNIADGLSRMAVAFPVSLGAFFVTYRMMGDMKPHIFDGVKTKKYLAKNKK